MATKSHVDLQAFVEVGTIRVDSRGRLTLAKPKRKGKAPKGLGAHVTAYKQLMDAEGTIMLVPLVEVPAREAWIYENPGVQASIQRGLAQAAQGKGTPLDWSKYPPVDEDDV